MSVVKEVKLLLEKIAPDCHGKLGRIISTLKGFTRASLGAPMPSDNYEQVVAAATVHCGLIMAQTPQSKDLSHLHPPTHSSRLD